MIDGVIPLPPVLKLPSKGALERLHTRDHLSARELSRLGGADGGHLLREITAALNFKLIPAKQNGVWHATTVRGILART